MLRATAPLRQRPARYTRKTIHPRLHQHRAVPGHTARWFQLWTKSDFKWLLRRSYISANYNALPRMNRGEHDCRMKALVARPIHVSSQVYQSARSAEQPRRLCKSAPFVWKTLIRTQGHWYAATCFTHTVYTSGSATCIRVQYAEVKPGASPPHDIKTRRPISWLAQSS